MIKCKFEDGKDALLRHVTVDVIVVKDNKILLVKRASHMLEGGKYGIIGGYAERGETLAEIAKREILEETGYTVKLTSFLRVKDSPDRPHEIQRQNISFVFIAEALEQIQDHDDESTEVTWFDLDKLPPKEEFAFDLYDDIELYKKHKDSPHPLPVF